MHVHNVAVWWYLIWTKDEGIFRMSLGNQRSVIDPLNMIDKLCFLSVTRAVGHR
jgi:hypothetical protein